MEKSSISRNICVNCGYDFQSENQIRTQQYSFRWKEYIWLNDESSETEIHIVDAVSQVFGLSFQDLYPECGFNNEIPIERVVLCSQCTLLLEKLYDSFHQMKKASDDDSILWNSLKNERNQISMKKEFALQGPEKFSDPQRRLSKLSRKIKREIDSDDDDNENRLLDYCEASDLTTPQVLITEDLIDRNGLPSDPLSSNDGSSVGLGLKIKSRLVKKCPGKIRRHKQVKSSLIKEEHKTKIRNKRPDDWKSGESITWKSFLKKRRLRHLKRRARKGKTIDENLQWKVKHLDSLSGAVPIKCCNTSFQTEEDFTSHVNLSHGNESELSEQECKFCKKKILSKYMQFHVNVLHQGKLMVYECPKCKKTFLKEWQLKKHKTKEHKTYIRNQWSHLKLLRKGSKVFCDKCGKYFAYKYLVNYHLPAVHKIGEMENQVHQCKVCGSNLKSARYLKLHMVRSHSASSTKCCDICGKICPNAKSLRSHKKMHDNSDKQMCTQCGIVLKHSYGLARHMDRMHGKAAIQRFTCEFCGKTTKTMTNMRIHMKVHEPNRETKQKYANLEETLTMPKPPEAISSFNYLSAGPPSNWLV